MALKTWSAMAEPYASAMDGKADSPLVEVRIRVLMGFRMQPRGVASFSNSSNKKRRSSIGIATLPSST